MKSFSKAVLSAAAIALAFAPVAAQANTRAGDSGSVYSTSAAQPGLARSAEGESFKDRSSIIIALLAAAAIIGGIIIAAQSGDVDQSPGT